MNIIIDISQFQSEYIQFLETKKNVIMEGNFTKLIYSDNCVTMNGLYLRFPLQYFSVEKLSNKHIVKFHPHTNSQIIKDVYEIENYLLDYYRKYYHCKKEQFYSLHEQLSQGNIKLYKEYVSDGGFEYSPSTFKTIEKKTNPTPKMMIKISGIWETSTQIGVTFKFIEMDHLQY